MTARRVLEGAYVATVDAAGTEHRAGHVVVDGDLIVAVGDGPASESFFYIKRHIPGKAGTF